MSNVDRYWDKSEAERAALSHEQVQSYLAVELMERGILNPRKPELEPVGEAPAIPRRSMVGIEIEGRYGRSTIEIAFATIEAAEAFLALGPVFVEHDHETGCEIGKSVDEACAVVAQTIHVVPLIDHAAIKTKLAEHKAAKERNAKAASAYAAAMTKVDQETRGIWADWNECRVAEVERQRVRATFDEYVKMTRGDRAMARGFLEKVYPTDKVHEALGEVEATPRPAPERNGVVASSDEGMPF